MNNSSETIGFAFNMPRQEDMPAQCDQRVPGASQVVQFVDGTAFHFGGASAPVGAEPGLEGDP